MIDGRVFTGEEVALMSSAHEEWKLQYRFADPADTPLRRGEYLMPVQLGEKELVTEVSELLNLFTADGRFISDHDERNFDVLFDKEVLRKLKLYYESNPRGYGKLAGMKIIERLRWIEGTERQVEKVREELQKSGYSPETALSSDGVTVIRITATVEELLSLELPEGYGYILKSELDY